MTHSYTELRDELEAAEDVALFAEQAAELVLELPSFLADRRSFETRAWAMVGWLASRAELADYFNATSSHSSPWPADALAPSLAEPLQHVETLLANGPPENFEPLVQGFDDLLVAGGTR